MKVKSVLFGLGASLLMHGGAFANKPTTGTSQQKTTTETQTEHKKDDAGNVQRSHKSEKKTQSETTSHPQSAQPSN